MDEPSDTDLIARYRPVLLEEQATLADQTAHSAEARRPVELDQQAVGRLSRMDALQGQAMQKGWKCDERRDALRLMQRWPGWTGASSAGARIAANSLGTGGLAWIHAQRAA